MQLITVQCNRSGKFHIFEISGSYKNKIHARYTTITYCDEGLFLNVLNMTITVTLKL